VKLLPKPRSWLALCHPVDPAKRLHQSKGYDPERTKVVVERMATLRLRGANAKISDRSFTTGQGGGKRRRVSSRSVREVLGGHDYPGAD